MSATRDPDLLLQAFLDEGPEVLPDRALLAVADDVHRLRQRTAFGPWRLSTMRTLLASAAVVAIVVAGAGIFIASRRFSRRPVPNRHRRPSLRSRAGGCPRPGRYLRLRVVHPPLCLHRAGIGGYAIQRGHVAGSIRSACDRKPVAPITIHDGLDLPNDLCQPTGVVPDLPDVEDWINGSEGLIVSPMVQLTSGSLSARYWDMSSGRTASPAATRRKPGHRLLGRRASPTVRSAGRKGCRWDVGDRHGAGRHLGTWLSGRGRQRPRPAQSADRRARPRSPVRFPSNPSTRAGGPATGSPDRAPGTRRAPMRSPYG